MRKVKWFLPVVVMCLFFMASPSAFASTQGGSGAQSHQTTSTGAALGISNPNSLKLLPGQQIDIPQKDGITRHIKLSQSRDTLLSMSIRPESSSGCAWDSESEWGTNIFGGILYKYTITQYACWDGSSITYLPAANRGGQTCCGWSLVSENHYNGWVSYPWEAFAHGDFAFGGPLGQSFAGWVEVYIQGDGSWWGNAG